MSHIKTTGLLLVGKEDIAVLDLAPMASFEGEEMEVVMRFGREEVDGMRLVDDHGKHYDYLEVESRSPLTCLHRSQNSLLQIQYHRWRDEHRSSGAWRAL